MYIKTPEIFRLETEVVDESSDFAYVLGDRGRKILQSIYARICEEHSSKIEHNQREELRQDLSYQSQKE